MAKLPEGDHHPRLDQLELTTQVALAGLDLVVPRVAVAGRSALDHVGDVHLFAVEPDLAEQILEQPPRGPDEGQTLLVLVKAGTLPDEHQVGLGVAVAEHDLGAGLAEGAGSACRSTAGEFVELSHRFVAQPRSSIAGIPPAGSAERTAASMARPTTTNTASPITSRLSLRSPHETAKAASPSYRV